MNICARARQRASLARTHPPTGNASRLSHYRLRHHSDLNLLQKPDALNVASTKAAEHDGSIVAMLSTPSWSVSSLLPPKQQPDGPPPITSKQLDHLLRLSALPPPASPEEEKSMMDTLAAQLHFVKEMQKVETTGVEPLRAIRDETKAAEKEQEITLDTLKEALGQEEVVGKFYKRIRRRAETTEPGRQPKDWDPLSQAQRTSGKFFVVDSGNGNND